MITGATRGTGLGNALARHLLKADNLPVVIPARGLGAANLTDQLQEIVAQSAGGRTDRPIYHVFCSPDPAAKDNGAARHRFWSLFEIEFGMTGQPYAGVEHHKDGRVHEHRIYGLVRASGGVVSLSWDYARREKCARVVEHEVGVEPVPSKHARSIVHALRNEGRTDVADRLVAAGTTDAARPVAPRTPRERMIEERTGGDLDVMHRAAIAAWNDGGDGAAFVAALRRRGLDLRQGRVGPVIVDARGTAHLATRVIGAAARRFEGKRILAATVKGRLEGLELDGGNGDGRDGDRATPDQAGSHAARDPGRAGTAGGGGVGVRRPDRDLVRADGCRVGSVGSRQGATLGRLRASTQGHVLVIRRKLNGLGIALARNTAAVEKARRAIERIGEIASAKRDRSLGLWGLTDIWGLPLE